MHGIFCPCAIHNVCGREQVLIYRGTRLQVESLYARSACADLEVMDPATMGDRLSLIFVYAAVTYALLLAIRARRRPRYPPGPKGLPVVGNLFDIPEVEGWIKYKDYGQQYCADTMISDS